MEVKELEKENEQLKKQLADKEQENERLKEEICKYEITLMDKNSQLKQLKDTEESYNNTMRYLNKIRSELLNLHKKN